MSRPKLRQQKADELYKMLKRGPSTFDADSPPGLSEIKDRKQRAAAKYAYDLWVNSWILPAVTALVPELKKHRTP